MKIKDILSALELPLKEEPARPAPDFATEKRLIEKFTRSLCSKKDCADRKAAMNRPNYDGLGDFLRRAGKDPEETITPEDLDAFAAREAAIADVDAFARKATRWAPLEYQGAATGRIYDAKHDFFPDDKGTE